LIGGWTEIARKCSTTEDFRYINQNGTRFGTVFVFIWMTVHPSIYLTLFGARSVSFRGGLFILKAFVTNDLTNLTQGL